MQQQILAIAVNIVAIGAAVLMLAGLVSQNPLHFTAVDCPEP